jgi:serine/threonine protein kinase
MDADMRCSRGAGSLWRYIHRKSNMLDLAMLLRFAQDIACGMEFLHRNGIVHRDLKSPNILVCESRLRLL